MIESMLIAVMILPLIYATMNNTNIIHALRVGMKARKNVD